MSISRLADAFEIDDLSPAIKLAMIYLADSASDETTQMTVYISDIASFCCVTERTAGMLLKDLVWKGLIANAQTLGLDDDDAWEVWMHSNYVAGTSTGYKKVPIPKALRTQVFERDGHACIYCGDTEARLAADHLVPEIRGGPTTLENLGCACVSCNSSKGTKTKEEFEEWRATR